MDRVTRPLACISASVIFGLSLSGSAHAALTLTAPGIADGFSLTTVVGGYFGTYGPLGEAILPDGNFVSASASTDRIYVFKDVDGQTLSNALVATPYAFQTGNPQYVMATVGGKAYGAQVQGGAFVQFANDGSFAPIPGLTGLTSNLGMWGDTSNGHLIASSNQGLVDIDPGAGSFRVINPSVFPDGVTVSPDGKIIYAEVSGNINSYNESTGAFLQTFSGGGHSPDGTGVISGGKFSGDLIVNNNDGTVALLDTTSGTESIIADGGTRGDFVSPDTNNGTLFLSQYDQVARLSCGQDCSIGGTPPPPPPIPEPTSSALLAVGLVGLFAMTRRRAGH
jgi:MYXO-CTERM domain-containing protein